MFWVWIGIFAEVEIMMMRVMDDRIDRILYPSPLHRYITGAT